MPASTLVDLVKVTSTTTGTGAISFGAAVSGYRGVEALVDGGVYSYSIQQDSDYEVGRLTYLAGQKAFVRSPIFSSAGGGPINLQPNAAVSFVALAEDLLTDVTDPTALAIEVARATAVESYLSQRIVAAVDGVVTFDTKATMLAAPAVDPGTNARVYKDSTAANNTIYINKTGAVGAWVVDTDYLNAIASALQPQVDAATAQADRAKTQADRAQALTAAIPQQALTLGDFVSTAAFTLVPSGGSVVRPPRGLTFPGNAGSGNGSQIRAQITPLATMVVGELYTFRFAADTSAAFTRPISGQMLVVTKDGPTARDAAIRVRTAGTRLFVEIDYSYRGDETSFLPSVITAFAESPTSDEWLQVTNVILQLSQPASDLQTANSKMLSDILSTTLAGYSKTFSLGNMRERVLFYQNPANGAVASGRWGFTFPSGTTGQNTTGAIDYMFNSVVEAGRSFGMRLVLATSPGFTRQLSGIWQVATASGNFNRTAVTTRTDYPGFIVYDFVYTVVGDELSLLPIFQSVGTVATTQVETVEVVAVVPFYANSLHVGQSSADEMLQDYVGDRVLGLPAQRATLVVEADNYTGPGGALASINDASVGRWRRVNLSKRQYNEPEWSVKDFTEIVGKGADSVVRLFQPDSTSAADISKNSAIYYDRTGLLRGFTVEVRNARYGIHCDTAGQVKNRITAIENLRVSHFGNDTAPANQWGAQNAIGAGTSGGQEFPVRDCVLYSKNAAAFSTHNNVNAIAPSRTVLQRNVLATDVENGLVLIANSIGSGQADEMLVEDCIIGGRFGHGANGWIPDDLLRQPADHNEITIRGARNTPSVFTNDDPGLALRIDSATSGAGSSVVVSGDAAPLLFGDGTTFRSFTRAGSPGFSGATWGWGDVSGALSKPFTTMGRRLGNRTGAARTLTIAIDGTSPVNVLFNADYTSTSNTAILTLINAALGSAGLASLYGPGARVRPIFTDEETQALNTTATGIPFRTVLAYNTSQATIRPMTSSDPTSAFAGIAWEDIPVGRTGRVKTRGHVALADVLRADGVAVAFGDTFSISPGQAGSIVKGGTQGLLKAIRSDAVAVR